MEIKFWNYSRFKNFWFIKNITFLVWIITFCLYLPVYYGIKQDNTHIVITYLWKEEQKPLNHLTSFKKYNAGIKK